MVWRTARTAVLRAGNIVDGAIEGSIAGCGGRDGALEEVEVTVCWADVRLGCSFRASEILELSP